VRQSTRAQQNASLQFFPHSGAGQHCDVGSASQASQANAADLGRSLREVVTLAPITASITCISHGISSTL